MKSRTVALLTAALLVTLLIGAYTLNVLSAPKLKLKAKWKPALYTINTPVPDPWKVEIYFAPPQPIENINPDTLRLEGHPWDPLHPPEPHPLKDRLNVYFLGADVLDVALPKLPHMGPGIYEVYVEITGNLYDGTPFRGTGSITFVVDSGLPE